MHAMRWSDIKANAQQAGTGFGAKSAALTHDNGRESLPVGRPDFKPGEGCLQFCVGSTPTLFRHSAKYNRSIQTAGIRNS